MKGDAVMSPKEHGKYTRLQTKPDRPAKPGNKAVVKPNGWLGRPIEHGLAALRSTPALMS